MTETAYSRTDNMCDKHPDRLGIGKCRGCGRVVCRDCVTRMKGIMYCPSCVSIRFKSQKGGSAQGLTTLISYVEFTVSFVLLSAFIYLLFVFIDNLRW
ncbi:MAG: hypothetical protein U5N86_07215 [Planctomycetota bacterium]|nr:hypothetical protein [Planctomycetota bacterium]